MDMSDFSLVWKRIKALEGETFRQIRGAEFTYEIFGAALKPNRTNQYLHRGQFEKAFKLMPLEDTKGIRHLDRNREV